MKFTIRDAKINDMQRVHDLIKTLASFEKEPDAVEVTVEELKQDGFGPHPAFHCFVAEVGSKIEGIAIIYNRYSTWKGKIIHLEDLIVSQSMRGTGLGTALLDTVVKYGFDLGVKRINWEVIDWNENAITFYEKKGAKVLRDWDVVWLDEMAIKNYVEAL